MSTTTDRLLVLQHGTDEERRMLIEELRAEGVDVSEFEEEKAREKKD